MADIRSRSMSKQAQQSFPRFRTIPRGVRLSAGNPSPSFRASSTEEKKGKLVSTKSAHAACPGAASGAIPAGSAAKAAMAASNQARASQRAQALEQWRSVARDRNFIVGSAIANRPLIAVVRHRSSPGHGSRSAQDVERLRNNGVALNAP